MKTTKIFSVLFSLVLICSFTLFSPMNISAKVKDSGSGTIDLTNEIEDNNFDEVNFKVSPGYGHLKVYIKNKGKSNVSVYLKNLTTKEIYMDKLIKPGQIYEWLSNKEGYLDGVGADKYELSFTSNGKPLNVYYSYKAADTEWKE
ncbi:hypothetical protein BK742_03355 [Bacillus thuringiensis serovar pingluonsis]|uniref:DUF4352 domain-containing protein n=2 Tax=Bacillus thuringiensis TaxID=1428 RepID=A0A243CWQ2_BACTU|nr:MULTISPECIES: hypothetical protein [Bacillus cereus group]MEB9685854.1 hypothetical protein [Bacillus anthracis]OTY48976.1 hypothetical protein BK742_03355 [Bacillus thuringiensis serovar pingluonsis]OTY76127.1 hypothetical protein BK749_12815 [Bacillus thuringiensis serovar vazensis]PFI78812.1 hypothetical protein COI83_26645 [Bacillus cereus]PFV95060.1 hypothetical protein COL21_15695 [Bacillus thuringiensis]